MNKIIKAGAKPRNILKTEYNIRMKCREIEGKMPKYLSDYFIYLTSAVAIRTRLAYLRDLHFFFEYLISSTTHTHALSVKEIPLDDIIAIKAKDVNIFLGDYCTSYQAEKNDKVYILSNEHKSISRKKSSLSVFFKFLYREEMMKDNISMGFNPIKIPKRQPDSIKKLEMPEVDVLLNAVNTGAGLTESELKYWNQTKWRDRAIIYLFVTYGLRISELQNLNISSFNFSRKEFVIFRKRDKEVIMPFNNTIELVMNEYLEHDRKKTKGVSPEHEDALFLSLQKTRLGEKAIRNLVKKYTSIPLNTSRGAGYSPHKLRATVASSLIEVGFSIFDVQNLMDHDNVTTTQVYATHRKNAKSDILRNFEHIGGNKDDNFRNPHDFDDNR